MISVNAKNHILMMVKVFAKNVITLVIFVLGFLGGLAALLTPCVFPMIPLTVSYFTKKQSKGHVDALIYGVSIVIIYVALAYGVTTIFGADALNALSTNVIFNLFFFLLFVLFVPFLLLVLYVIFPYHKHRKVPSYKDPNLFYLGVK